MSNEVVSSTEGRNQISSPESTSLRALISSAAYPPSDSCMLQSCSDVAVTKLMNVPNAMNQMDLITRLTGNKRVVVPLPTIQAVAGIQLPATQAEHVVPDSASLTTLAGIFLVTVLH